MNTNDDFKLGAMTVNFNEKAGIPANKEQAVTTSLICVLTITWLTSAAGAGYGNVPYTTWTV